MELAQEAGFPAGTLNMIHGTHDCVNFMCDNKGTVQTHTTYLCQLRNFGRDLLGNQSLLSYQGVLALG